MIVPDALIFIITLLMALFFTVETYDFPARDHNGPENAAGPMTSLIRVSIFPFFASACWYVLSIMSASLNNCSATYNSCFTSPTFATTTASIYAAFGAAPLTYLFDALYWMHLVIGTVFIFYFGLKPLADWWKGRNTSDLGPPVP
jgi:hypothetical protein